MHEVYRIEDLQLDLALAPLIALPLIALSFLALILELPCPGRHG